MHYTHEEEEARRAEIDAAKATRSSAEAALKTAGPVGSLSCDALVRVPSEDSQQAFATSMRTARENIGLTPAEVENRTGVPAKYIEELEAGKVRRPQPWALYYLAIEYSLDYKSLMLACGNLTRRLPGKLRAL